MSFELTVALRYLFARRGQAFISVISWISVAGVALGVMALTATLAIMNGFTEDLREKLIGFTAQAVLFQADGHMVGYDALRKTVAETPGVTGVTPFIYSELMLSTSVGFKGVAIRGIDPATAPNVLGALRKIVEGSVEDLADPEGLPGIIIGRELKRKLGLHLGSRVNLMSPSGQQSSAGFQPKIMTFRVVGVFQLGLFEQDSTMVFVSLDAARKTLGWPPGMITGLELSVSDIYKAGEILNRAVEAAGPENYYGQTWMQMSANLFSALKLEKTIMGLLLVLIILVASFSIVTALVMLVMEKTRDIAIMMSMGATPRTVRRIFITQGMIIGGMGTALGLALGLLFCWLLGKYHFELPPGVYSLNYVPVLLEWPDVFLTMGTALVICFAATLYPARQAARLEPVEALRHE